MWKLDFLSEEKISDRSRFGNKELFNKITKRERWLIFSALKKSCFLRLLLLLMKTKVQLEEYPLVKRRQVWYGTRKLPTEVQHENEYWNIDQKDVLLRSATPATFSAFWDFSEFFKLEIYLIVLVGGVQTVKVYDLLA